MAAAERLATLVDLKLARVRAEVAALSKIIGVLADTIPGIPRQELEQRLDTLRGEFHERFLQELADDFRRQSSEAPIQGDAELEEQFRLALERVHRKRDTQ